MLEQRVPGGHGEQPQTSGCLLPVPPHTRSSPALSLDLRPGSQSGLQRRRRSPAALWWTAALTAPLRASSSLWRRSPRGCSGPGHQAGGISPSSRLCKSKKGSTGWPLSLPRSFRAPRPTYPPPRPRIGKDGLLPFPRDSCLEAFRKRGVDLGTYGCISSTFQPVLLHSYRSACFPSFLFLPFPLSFHLPFLSSLPSFVLSFFLY